MDPNTRLYRLLAKVHTWLGKKLASLIQISDSELPYTALSPIENADIGNDYQKALDWALKNQDKNDIKNIALTGPYGSGKSSILKTYTSNYQGKDLKFLNISLATFKEEEDIQPSPKKEALLPLIELSILQQIFYHEEDEKIPDSRFRKIKNFTSKELRWVSFVFLVFLLSVIQLFKPKFIENILQIEFSQITRTAIHYSSLTIALLLLLIITYRSVRVINSLKISKLNFQNAEIEIGNAVNKSILNHHIDEILYFFEVTPYNVVIIEDLDRFNQTEIFTKLREINLLINNSKKIKKNVVFIYAVRDDMFCDHNERTKFFDFIIPVIPIINTSNSSEKLIEKRNRYNYSISENLIDSIALFLDDMRLLHSILNEFHLYRNKLNNTLNQDKLLAIIVYKNIFPKDFTLLSANEGILYETLNKKQSYIAIEIKNIDAEISNLKDNIVKLDALKITSVKELRFLYLFFYASNLPGFIGFLVNDTKVAPDAMASDENFELLRKNIANYSYQENYYLREKPIPLKFGDVEKLVSKTETYVERKKSIDDWNNNKRESLKRDIQSLELKRSKSRNLRIRELLQSGLLKIEINNAKQLNLINTFLRNGYIDEDYLDYITLFYEGSITKKDHQFLLNVKSQTKTEFSYQLTKINKLIDKINVFEFDKDHILNYSLVNYILKNENNYNQIINLLIAKLSDESSSSISFIDGFINECSEIEKFIRLLANRWKNLWPFIEHNSNFTIEHKNIYFKLIIEFADLHDIERIYKDVEFKAYLLNSDSFLNIIPDFERIKSLIKTLNIKFKKIDFENSPKELLDSIYEGDYYELNNFMIKSLLIFKNQYSPLSFASQNYHSIKNSSLGQLIGYLENNINTYIENVYLKIETNTEENEISLIKLLDFESLTEENKEEIIELTNAKISDISKISDTALFDSLLSKSKIIPTWNNILYAYKAYDNQVSDPLIRFLESDGNALFLSKQKIKLAGDDDIQSNLMESIILTNNLSDKTYGLLIKSFPYSFTINKNTLTKGKVTLLIQNGSVTFNEKNFTAIKKQFPDLHIEFLTENKSEFLKNIGQFASDSNDITKLLESNNFTSGEKNKIVEEIDESILVTSTENLKEIGGLVLKDKGFRVSDSLLQLVLTSKNLTVEQKIRIHNSKHSQIQIDYYNTLLNSLNEPFSDITINGKRPLLPKTEYNTKFVEILESKQYISKFDIEDKGIRISTYRKNGVAG